MLLDSNIIIYATHPDQNSLRRFIAENASSVSIVSYVEVLGYHHLTDEERQLLQDFFAAGGASPMQYAVNKPHIR